MFSKKFLILSMYFPGSDRPALYLRVTPMLKWAMILFIYLLNPVKAHLQAKDLVWT